MFFLSSQTFNISIKFSMCGFFLYLYFYHRTSHAILQQHLLLHSLTLAYVCFRVNSGHHILNMVHICTKFDLFTCHFRVKSCQDNLIMIQISTYLYKVWPFHMSFQGQILPRHPLLSLVHMFYTERKKIIIQELC